MIAHTSAGASGLCYDCENKGTISLGGGFDETRDAEIKNRLKYLELLQINPYNHLEANAVIDQLNEYFGIKL